MKFNKINVAQASLPAGKADFTFFDDDVPGFGLRVRAGGSRAWVFQYRVGSKQRRITFGTVTAMTAQEARERAGQLHAQVKLGQDPFGQKVESQAQASETFEKLLRPYMAHKKNALRPRSYVEVERHLLTHAKRLHGLQLAKVDRRNIAALVTEVAAASGPTEANHVRGSLSAFFAWGICEGLVEANPVINTTKATENRARERTLSDNELRDIWAALPADDYGDIIKLLALTGQRREEIGALTWDEVDLDEETILLPGERTKNGKPHLIPLSDAAADILRKRPGSERPHVFGVGVAGYQGWSKSKEALDAGLTKAGKKVAPWTSHDLRRTMSTRMHDELGIAPHIVEAVLNHISGHRAGVAGVYNRALYAKEKAAALTQWAEHLVAIVNGKRSKVIAMAGKRAG